MDVNRPLETFTNFGIFVNRFCDKIYGMHIFAELADNEPSGCSRLCAEENGAIFEVYVRGPVCLKAGGTGPRSCGKRDI